MQTSPLMVDLKQLLSPSYDQIVWGVGYTQVELQDNNPLTNGNPTAYVHEYDFTLRQHTLPSNIMDVCKAAFSWVPGLPDNLTYFRNNNKQIDNKEVMRISNYPFDQDEWVNSNAARTIYPNLTATRGKVFVPKKTNASATLVATHDKYIYLLDFFDTTILDLIKEPNELSTLMSPKSTRLDILRRALYNVPPQGLWGDCYCMAPMGATHILLALQQASELASEEELDAATRYRVAVKAQKYATGNRFSSTGMRTCYQEYSGKRNGSSVLAAGGETSTTMAAIKLHGVAPYSRVTQPLLLNDANSFVDFILHDNWYDLQPRTQLELAEFYAKFTSLQTLSPALEFGRQYCDVDNLRMIAFAPVRENQSLPEGITSQTEKNLSNNNLPGFGYFPESSEDGVAPIPNPAVIELIKQILSQGLPLCCGGTISNGWHEMSQTHGCVPPAPIDDQGSYSGGHETIIVGMCEREDTNQDIKELFDYWQNHAAQVENEDVAGLSGLPGEKQEVYTNEKYLLFIMNHWDYWRNTELLIRGPSGLNWIPKSEAEHEKSIWLNEKENAESIYQLGTSPVLGASPEQRAQIPSHVYILPGSYLFYVTSMTVILNPTYLSADYEEESVPHGAVNATSALLQRMGAEVDSKDVASIGIQIDPDRRPQ